MLEAQTETNENETARLSYSHENFVCKLFISFIFFKQFLFYQQFE